MDVKCAILKHKNVIILDNHLEHAGKEDYHCTNSEDYAEELFGDLGIEYLLVFFVPIDPHNNHHFSESYFLRL